MKKGLILIMTILHAILNQPHLSATAKPYAPKETVTDILHGQPINDDYRWLENDADARTAQFTADQNAYTRSVLEGLPTRSILRKQFENLFSDTSIATPVICKDYYFYNKRESNQNHSILYVMHTLNGTDTKLIDPNELSTETPTALDWFYPSPNGTYIAYGLSTNGSENSTLFIKKNDGTQLADVITRARFCSLAWKHDETGFYYTRCPEPGTVPEGEENYHRKVYFHTLGTDLAQDLLVYEDTTKPTAHPHIHLSKDNRWLLISMSEGWSTNTVYLLDCNDPEAVPRPITPQSSARYGCMIVDDHLYIHTNENAPHYKLFKTPIHSPQRANWIEVLPESEYILNSIEVTKSMLIAHLSVDVTSRVRVYDHDGHFMREIELPGPGNVGAIEVNEDETVFFIGFQSFTQPYTTYLYDAQTQLLTPSPFAPETKPRDIVVKQVFYISKDGTKIPLFICHKQGLALEGATPTILTGYGGFSFSYTPGYNNSILNWVENGGVFAIANIRGGAEYGEPWHQAGMLKNKQNVFDDFIGAAEYLIENKYTNPHKLAIRGRSNGGLLVGSAMIQRPDLFKAVVCEVPLLDMVRYHQFLIGRLWIPEYGCADNPEDFDHLFAYSPYHNVKPGTQYPATLILTADTDTRVHPLHARKMAALLQDASPHDPDAPILLHTEFNAGHGPGTPISKKIDEYVDVFSFLAWQLGLEIN